MFFVREHEPCVARRVVLVGRPSAFDRRLVRDIAGDVLTLDGSSAQPGRRTPMRRRDSTHDSGVAFSDALRSSSPFVAPGDGLGCGHAALPSHIRLFDRTSPASPRNARCARQQTSRRHCAPFGLPGVNTALPDRPARQRSHLLPRLRRTPARRARRGTLLAVGGDAQRPALNGTAPDRLASRYGRRRRAFWP